MLTADRIQQNMMPICEQILVKNSVGVNSGIGIHTRYVVISNIASRIESGTATGQIMVSVEVDKATSRSFEYGGGVE